MLTATHRYPSQGYQGSQWRVITESIELSGLVGGASRNWNDWFASWPLFTLKVRLNSQSHQYIVYCRCSQYAHPHSTRISWYPVHWQQRFRQRIDHKENRSSVSNSHSESEPTLWTHEHSVRHVVLLFSLTTAKKWGVCPIWRISKEKTKCTWFENSGKK